MSRTLSQPVAPRARKNGASDLSLDDVQHFVMEDASWELYETLLREIRDRAIRVTYDDGRLEIMSPLPQHEAVSRIICLLVVELALATNTPMHMLGSSTLRRKLKRKGLEPDECFYFANEAKIRGKKRLSLPKDPPPDLAVEIDITRRSIDRLPIYAALGVPEIWHSNGRQLRCLHLSYEAYAPAERSLTYPFLRVADLQVFIDRADRDGHTATLRAFREWIKKNGWVK